MGMPVAPLAVAVSCCVAPCRTLTDAGVICTVVTTGADTTTVADALFPSTVAVTTAVPGATPVTTPCDEITATAAELVLHETLRPVSTVPAASNADAVMA